MLRILSLWAEQGVLDPRYYFSRLRRGHFRSRLRWFFAWRRTTVHEVHQGLSVRLLDGRCLVARIHLCCFHRCLSSRVWTPWQRGCPRRYDRGGDLNLNQKDDPCSPRNSYQSVWRGPGGLSGCERTSPGCSGHGRCSPCAGVLWRHQPYCYDCYAW